MAKLIYAANMALDGCTEDEHSAFDWSRPDDDVFAFITTLMRAAGTYLYGRRMYETMAVWETDFALAGQSALTADFAGVWKQSEKIVYSTTLSATTTVNTRLERQFVSSSVLAMKDAVSTDMLIGGPNLASQAMAAGLVDEIALFIWPIILGGAQPRTVPWHAGTA